MGPSLFISIPQQSLRFFSWVVCVVENCASIQIVLAIVLLFKFLNIVFAISFWYSRHGGTLYIDASIRDILRSPSVTFSASILGGSMDAFSKVHIYELPEF